MTYSFFQVRDFVTLKSYYFFTSNNIHKFIYNRKRNKADSLLKTVLLNNNYQLECVKTMECNRLQAIEELKNIEETNCEPKQEVIITNEVKPIRDSPIEVKPIERDSHIDLHHKTRTFSVAIGKNNEDRVFEYLTSQMKMSIERATFKFCLFDFYDNSNCILYELKTLTYSVDKYATAVMNYDKIVFHRMVFLFEYSNEDGKCLYYHIYNPNKTYNKRMIKPFNRLNYCEIIDIPINELRVLNHNPVLESPTYLEIETFKTVLKTNKA